MSSLILPACHLMAYGTLLGTTLFHSLLIVVTALTYPPASLLTLYKEAIDVGLLAFAGITAFANLAKYGPSTTVAMVDRIHQETRDGKKFNDPSGPSEEMHLKNRAFSRQHAMAIHLNLMSVGATVAYGLRLASKLRF